MEVLTLDGSRNPSVWNEYLRADYAVWPVGKECDLHCHADAAEVFVFLDGQCEMTVGDEVETLGAGQTVYVGPGAWHKLKSVGERPLAMFLAVMPNHSPTHTFRDADGSTYDRDRQPPEPGDPKVAR
jgi:mannose-6-phosphate isomerase-like protein (cupin superfamily)